MQLTTSKKRIQLIHSKTELPEWLTTETLSQFFHESLKPYEDKLADIRRALSHVLESKPSSGGFVALATDDDDLLGSAVIHYTPWSGYVPENLLLFVAVDPDHRRKGLGRALIERALANCDGDVKLHVDYDNPAKELYERLGFTSKHAEMRFHDESPDD